jgi:hypothetical protein
MAAYTDIPLEQRLVNSATAALTAQSFVSTLQLELKERDEDTAITPKAEGATSSASRPAKKRRLIVSVSDEGRATSIDTPIRNLRLSFTLRMNAKSEDGDAPGMHEAAAAVERWLDDTNLKNALDSEALGVRVMLAVRRPGSGLNREGVIRRQRYEVECKCVAVERTNG